jgi:hypothetical protein
MAGMLKNETYGGKIGTKILRSGGKASAAMQNSNHKA